MLTLNDISTTPLLRPAQLSAAQDERAGMEEKIRSPHIQDKSAAAKQLRNRATRLEKRKRAKASK